MNPLKLTDTYSGGHEEMKENVDEEIAYIYNRNKPMILFGFNRLINEVFGTPITRKDVDEAEKDMVNKVGVWFNRETFDRVVDEFNGYMPLSVKALPDGSYVPRGTPFAEVSNTVRGFGGLVTYWESRLLKAWWDCCAATEART